MKAKMLMFIICHGIKDLESKEINISEKGIFVGHDSQNEIICYGPGISGRHLRLFSIASDLFLEDMKSQGTFCNGKKITQTQKISSGCEFQIGTWLLRFENKNKNASNIIFDVFFEKMSASASEEKKILDKQRERIDEESDITAMTIMFDAHAKELSKVEEVSEFPKTMITRVDADLSIKNVFTEGREIGKYIIVKMIGKGGMGEIYLAKHKTLGTYRALKILPKIMREENLHFFERFIREAKLASEIKHPNVVGVMDVENDTTYGISYIVMEYIDGGSLRRILKSTKHLSEEQAVVIVEAVCAALLAAEERKIVHRDIKPDNIMFTKRGEVKLADLGIAKNDEEDNVLTKTNVMIGTPAYLSPEQVENAKDVDIRADIYSLGATFYEMLTGQHPYPGKTTYDILHKLFSDPVPDPRKINPSVSPATADIVMKMLAKDANKRFQTIGELIKMFDATFPRHTANETTDLIKNAIDGICDENLQFGSGINKTSWRLRGRGIRRILPKWALIPTVVIPSGIVIMFFYNDLWLFFLSQTSLTGMKAPQRKAVQSSGSERDNNHSLFIKTLPYTEIKVTGEDGILRTYSAGKSGNIQVSNLSQGIYVIGFQLNKFIPVEKRVEIPASKTLDAALLPDVKKLTLITTPHAKVFLTGRENLNSETIVPGSGILIIPDLYSDILSIKVERSGFASQEQTFSFLEDKTIKMPLQQLFSELNLISPSNSHVELIQNGKVMYSGVTNTRGSLTIRKIAHGEYTIRVKCAGYSDEEFMTDLSTNRSLTVQLRLKTYNISLSALPGTRIQLIRDNKVLDTFIVPDTGKLILEELLAGKYELHADKNGYVSVNETIAVNGNKAVAFFLSEKTQSKKESSVSVRTEVGGISAQGADMRKGVLVLLLSGSSEVTDYGLNRSAELKIGEQPWRRFKTLRFQTELEEGEHLIRVRIDGMQDMTPQKIKIHRGKLNEVVFSPQPYPASLTVKCSAKDAEFCINSKWHKCGASITVEPFIENKILIKAPGYVQKEITTKVDAPGKNESFPVELERAVVVLSSNQNYRIGEKALKAKKYQEALEAFLCAANDGDAEGAFQTARIYEQGLGLNSSDKKRAYQYYCKAAGAGHSEAAYRAGKYIQKGDGDGDKEDMMRFYRASAEKKHAEALFVLGGIYRDGEFGITKDEKRSLNLLLESAELGNPQAMYAAGLLFEKKYDFKEAILLYEKALKNGVSEAQIRLNVLKKLR